MGGLAFAKGPNALYTPRMPRNTYEHVRDNCHALLRKVFVVVATPIEGPGKTDFGDIDVFVTLRKEEYFGESCTSELLDYQREAEPLEEIGSLLGAVRKIQEQKSAAMFAIPWPRDLLPGTVDTPDVEGDKPCFIQVDVHICPSLQNLEWFLFKHAHGDLWNLLGSIIRPYGLTVDEVGMYLRIPEIEKLNRNKAKVLLTTDPCQVLNFLGLEFSGSEWEMRFDSMEEIFEYAATSRFFWVRPETSDTNADKDGNEEIGGDYTKKSLKSNDRQRMRQRPLFRRWIEEFLPMCQEQGRFANRTLSRDETRANAFQQFGIQKAYDNQVIEFQKQRQREGLWRDVIKPAIPLDIEPQLRSHAASALKKIIMEDDLSFGIRPKTPLRDVSGLYLENEVCRFVKVNWEAAGRAAWEKQQARYLEHLATKRTSQTALGN